MRAIFLGVVLFQVICIRQVSTASLRSSSTIKAARQKAVVKTLSGAKANPSGAKDAAAIDPKIVDAMMKQNPAASADSKKEMDTIQAALAGGNTAAVGTTEGMDAGMKDAAKEAAAYDQQMAEQAAQEITEKREKEEAKEAKKDGKPLVRMNKHVKKAKSDPFRDPTMPDKDNCDDERDLLYLDMSPDDREAIKEGAAPDTVGCFCAVGTTCQSKPAAQSAHICNGSDDDDDDCQKQANTENAPNYDPCDPSHIPDPDAFLQLSMTSGTIAKPNCKPPAAAHNGRKHHSSTHAAEDTPDAGSESDSAQPPPPPAVASGSDSAHPRSPPASALADPLQGPPAAAFENHEDDNDHFTPNSKSHSKEDDTDFDVLKDAVDGGM